MGGEGRILVVDDDSGVTALCRAFLEARGYTVFTASNATDAIAFLERDRVGLVLTDIRMPGMSGLDLIRAIKKRGEQVAIVVITAFGTINVAVEALKLGALGFVVKPFTADELHSAIEHAQERSRLIQENIRLRSFLPLFEVSTTLMGETNLDDLLQLIVQVVKNETGSERTSLMLIENGELVVRAFSGFDAVEEARLRRRIGEGVAGSVARTGEPLLISGQAERAADPSIGSAIAVPLKVRDRVIGVINAAKLQGRPQFTESDLELMSILGGQAAVAIENARLVRQIRQGYLRSIESLVCAIEVKDAYTQGHSTRVARYGRAIAREMGLGAAAEEEVLIAGILHDLGKIGSSETILLKSGPLTPEEFARMQEHPLQSVKILEPMGVSRGILLAVRHHHEWLSGEGYPDGIKGEEIPLASRILLVADTIDAMTSDRVYRKARSIEQTRAELERYRDRQFDPRVVGAVQRLLDRAGPQFFRAVQEEPLWE